MSGHAPRLAPPSLLLPAHSRLLLAIRWQRSWTQVQLAEELGVHPMTVSRWERGEHEPHPMVMSTLRSLLSPAA